MGTWIQVVLVSNYADTIAMPQLTIVPKLRLTVDFLVASSSKSHVLTTQFTTNSQAVSPGDSMTFPRADMRLAPSHVSFIP